MGVVLRKNKTTGNWHVTTDEAIAQETAGLLVLSGAVFMAFVSQMMLPSGISFLVRIPLFLFSLAVGGFFGMNMLGAILSFVGLVAYFVFTAHFFPNAPGGLFVPTYVAGVLGAIINLVILRLSMQPASVAEPVAEPVDPVADEIEALRKQRAERRGEVYKPPVEAVGFKALSKHEKPAQKKRRQRKEPFIGNAE